MSHQIQHKGTKGQRDKVCGKGETRSSLQILCAFVPLSRCDEKAFLTRKNPRNAKFVLCLRVQRVLPQAFD